jgi:hypothetical protein
MAASYSQDTQLDLVLPDGELYLVICHQLFLAILSLCFLSFFPQLPSMLERLVLNIHLSLLALTGDL